MAKFQLQGVIKVMCRAFRLINNNTRLENQQYISVTISLTTHTIMLILTNI